MQKLIDFLERELETRNFGCFIPKEYIDSARDALNEAHALEALLRKCAHLLPGGDTRDEVLASLGDKDTRHE
jgi:hypothetical protein